MASFGGGEIVTNGLVLSLNTGNSANTYLGSAFGTALFLNGNIATFTVYNRALTSAEILQNYDATKSRFGL
jgi:hypothetical protein